MPISGEQPDLNALPPESSPVNRRLATQHVREARDRLTSSGFRVRVAAPVCAESDFRIIRHSASRRDRRLHVERLERSIGCWNLDGGRAGDARGHSDKVPAVPGKAS